MVRLAGRRRCGGRAGTSIAVLMVGAALELLQACALVHDDIIDRSERRRGRPATHRAVAKRHADAGLAGDPEHYGCRSPCCSATWPWPGPTTCFWPVPRPWAAIERAAPVWRAMRTEVLAGQLLDLAVTASIDADPADAGSGTRCG